MSRRKHASHSGPGAAAPQEPNFRLPPPQANRFRIGLSLALLLVWLGFLAYVAMG